MTEKVREQILAIRKTGRTNMFDVPMVQYIANEMRCGFTSWWYSSKNTAASMCISSSRANANRCNIHSFYSE